jgi:hypothetical protein
MPTIAWIAAAFAAVAILVLAVPVAKKYFLFRGRRVITCPENNQPAGVSVDARHAALGSGLHLETCSRWPERTGCGQECLKQIEAAPADCLVNHILTQWYEGKVCACCGKAIGHVNWHDHKPGLLDPEGKARAWDEVAAEAVPAALQSHRPVCWNCHTMNLFRRAHPELVLDRSRTQSA